MPFPFSIKYSTTIKEKILPEDYNSVLQYIKEFVINKTAEDVIIEENELRFKVSFFRFGWSWNIMVPIEKGIFTIVENEKEHTLTYEFFMYNLFIATSVMSFFIGIVSRSYWTSVLCFFWLGGMNWIIAVTRHRSMLDEIASGIESLLEMKSL